jgi:hypothetical protein
VALLVVALVAPITKHNLVFGSVRKLTADAFSVVWQSSTGGWGDRIHGLAPTRASKPTTDAFSVRSGLQC